MEISLEAVNPTRNALLSIEYTIKRLKPLPPQVPLSDTVVLPMVKYFLTGSPLLRVEEKINTNKNINYPPILNPQLPSTSLTNKYTSEAANTVYGIIQKPIEYLKEKYGTKTTEATTQRTFYDNHSTTE